MKPARRFRAADGLPAISTVIGPSAWFGGARRHFVAASAAAAPLLIRTLFEKVLARRERADPEATAAGLKH